MLEPEAFNNILKICAVSGTDDGEQLKEHALYSIAISLKRIADKLELSQKQPVIMSAEEYAQYCAEKNGY